ncbi:MAG: hypothetical protein LBM27_06090 [Lactobacillaceae bacterium]|jgi:hypothetical protein|nr:hypothetical protein [Lactobacillaceae bacterium]
MKNTSRVIGNFKGQDIIEYSIENDNGLKVSILNLNGIWNHFSLNGENVLEEVNLASVPDDRKQINDVIVSPDSLEMITDEFDIKYQLLENNTLVFSSKGTDMMIGFKKASSIDSNSINTVIRFDALKLRITSEKASVNIISANPLIVETKAGVPFEVRYRLS